MSQTEEWVGIYSIDPFCKPYDRFSLEGPVIIDRCNAKNASGKRCLRKSRYILNGVFLCNSHLRTKKHLCITDSYIESAGKGVFATCKYKNPVFRKGEIIGSYDGELLSGSDFSKRYPHRNHITPYCMKLDNEDGDVADSLFYRGVLAMINDGPNTNTVAISDGAQIVIEALTDIYDGDELYLSYGYQYWKTMQYNHNAERYMIQTSFRRKK